MLSVILLCVVIFYSHAECCYAERHYAECRYAECRYAECRGVLVESLFLLNFSFQSKSVHYLSSHPYY
jgi:hypothetical protein